MANDEEPLSADQWASLAHQWGITPEQLPQAVRYLCVAILAASGDLQLVEIQYRHTGERHIFELRDPDLGSGLLWVDRPRGWDRTHETWAMADLLEALELFDDDDQEDQAA
jgi:hypothetical protein